MIREQPHPHPDEDTLAVVIRPMEPNDAPLLRLWRSEASVRRHQPLGSVSARQIRAEITARRHHDLDRQRGERFDWVVEYRLRHFNYKQL